MSGRHSRASELAPFSFAGTERRYDRTPAQRPEFDRVSTHRRDLLARALVSRRARGTGDEKVTVARGPVVTGGGRHL